MLQTSWEEIILAIISARNGDAYTQEVYADLEKGRFINLTEDQLRETEYQGRPAYQHTVRSVLSNLMQSGDLRRVARARYALTEQGNRRLVELGVPVS